MKILKSFKTILITFLGLFLLNLNCSATSLWEYPTNVWSKISSFLDPETNYFLESKSNLVPPKRISIAENNLLIKRLKQAKNIIKNNREIIENTKPIESWKTIDHLKNKILNKFHYKPILNEQEKINRLKLQTNTINNLEKCINEVQEINSFIKSTNSQPWWKFWKKGIHDKLATGKIKKLKQAKYAHKLTKNANSAYIRSCKESLEKEQQLKSSKNITNALISIAKHQTQYGDLPIYREIFKIITRELSFIVYPENPVLRLSFIVGISFYLYKEISKYIKNRNSKNPQTIFQTIKTIIKNTVIAGFTIQNFNILTARGYKVLNELGKFA